MKMAYKIQNLKLPEATKLMNYNENFFVSRVENIIPLVGMGRSIVVVDIQGDYPYHTDKWKEFIEDEDTYPLQ